MPGHEVVGRVTAVGAAVSTLKPGQRVGVGWYAKSCMTCDQCLSGNHNLCGSNEAVIVGRHGGFADHLRLHRLWAIPLPDGLAAETTGPLLCGGITVFNPIVQFGVRPTDRVGVIGIGGLGHLAIRFLHAWGCEVTAFSSDPSKESETRELGADRFINSRDEGLLQSLAGTYDFIISTVNVPLKWETYLAALRPKGRLHFVGALLEPISVPVFALLTGQKSISASPLGSPATVNSMLQFCLRHKIAPITQHYPMSQVNEALAALRAGKARYRIVLKADF